MNVNSGHNPTPEERKRHIKKIKRKRRMRLAIVIAAFILLLSLVVLPVVAYAVFRVDEYKIDGKTRYTQEQIIEAAGISPGSTLLFARTEKAENSITSKLPYIEKVTITKALPGTLVIKVESGSEVYSFNSGSGSYVLASPSLKTLESVSTPPEGAITVICQPPVGAQIGSQLAFTSEKDADDKTLELLKLIKAGIKKAGLNGITSINLLDTNGIRIVYQGRLLLRIGNSDRLDSKLALGKKVINDQDDVNAAQYGKINLTIEKKAYFLPCEPAEVEAAATAEKDSSVAEQEELGTKIGDVDETDESSVAAGASAVTTEHGDDTDGKTAVQSRREDDETTASSEHTTAKADDDEPRE